MQGSRRNMAGQHSSWHWCGFHSMGCASQQRLPVVVQLRAGTGVEAELRWQRKRHALTGSGRSDAGHRHSMHNCSSCTKGMGSWQTG